MLLRYHYYKLEQIKMRRKDLLHTLTAAEEIQVTMQNYVCLKTSISALTAVLVMVTFLICNVRLAVRAALLPSLPPYHKRTNNSV